MVRSIRALSGPVSAIPEGKPLQKLTLLGVTAFPDWFASGTQEYWNNEFTTFFSAETGVDIDALWIGMYIADYPGRPCLHNDRHERSKQLLRLALQ